MTNAGLPQFLWHSLSQWQGSAGLGTHTEISFQEYYLWTNDLHSNFSAQ